MPEVRLTLEEVAEWRAYRQAWYAAMAEAGFPRCRAELLFHFDGVPLSCWVATWSTSYKHPEWKAGIKAWCLLDPRRPEWITQIPLVGRILSGQN